MTLPTITTVQGATPVVEMGVGDTRTGGEDAGQWQIDHWDAPEAVWAGTEPLWRDITCDVIDIEINQGRDRSIDRWQVGNATIVVNNQTGWADFRAVGTGSLTALTVRPGRAVRIGMSLDGAAPHWMFRGFIDSMKPSYAPDDVDRVEIECIDAKGMAGKVDLARIDPPEAAGDPASTRIHRILNLAEWREADRVVDAVSATMMATEYGQKTVDLLDETADSCGGVVYGDADGRVVFRNPDWLAFNANDPPDGFISADPGIPPVDIVDGAADVVFGDSDVIWGLGSVAPGVCPSEWELSSDLADYATRILLARRGEVDYVVTDTFNVVVYGVETFTRKDLVCEADGVLNVIARRTLNTMSATYMPDVEAVTIDAATSTAARDLCATVDPTRPSRYRCKHVANPDRILFDSDFLAAGVEHRIDADTWTCRIRLADAQPFAIANSRWQSARWDVDEWSPEVFAVAAEARALAADLIGAVP